MTAAERLLAYFDRISEAPDAVPRLRRFVLDLAVRGGLSGYGRGIRCASPIGSDFAVPETWSWRAIEEVADVDMGQSPSSDDCNQSGNGMPFYQGKADFGQRSPTTRYWCTRPTKIAQRNDVLISVRAPVGPTNVASEECCVGRGLASLRPHSVDLEYFLLCIRARESALAAIGFGTTFIAINKKQLVSFPIPVPPVEEQHRIVAKVDELMAVCDRLGAAQKERESRRDRLVSVSLARLNRPVDSAASREDARFHFQYLRRLTTSRRHIQQVRETILSLAARGALVPQDPTDQSAEAWLLALGKPNSTAERDVSAPLTLPNGWTWRRLDDVFEVAGGIQKTPQRAPQSNAYPYLGVSNVYRGRLDLVKVKRFELQAGELQRRRLESGDILIIEGNGSFNEIGRCAKWNGEIDDCVHQNHVIRCRPFDVAISDFVLLFLNSPDGIEVMQRLAITSSGLYSLSVGKIKQIEIPLPPRSEQRRIVARVNELMTVCARLEAQLEASRAAQASLLEATLRDALTHEGQVRTTAQMA